MLEIRDITKTFPAAGGAVVTVLDDLDGQFDDGEFVSIVGKSGSGKSTLLSILGTLDQPTDGHVIIDGREVSQLKGSTLTDYRCHEIGFVFQNYQLIPNLTALENVCLPMEFAGHSKTVRLKRARQLLDEVGITGDHQSARPGKMSGGEQQRVAIARALANKPSLILADEPTGNLDEATGQMIVDLLKNLAQSENVTIVVVTHDLDIARQADKSYRLTKGKLVLTS